MSRPVGTYDAHVLLEHLHPTWCRHLHWFDEAAERGAPMPEAWKALSKKPLPEIIDGLWGGENGHFPEYVAYLKEHLVCLFVGEDRKGFKDGKYNTDDQPGIYLIYFIRDAEIQGWSRLHGHEFLIAGGPTPEPDIVAFEAVHGKLPEDSKALLRIHHFMYLISNGLVAAIPHESKIIQSTVTNLGMMTSEADGTTQHECTAWIGSTQMPYCWVRLPGQSDWEPELMQVSRFEKSYDPQTRIALKDLLLRHW